MLKNIFTIMMATLSFVAAAQLKVRSTIESLPFLTKNNTYTYVDKDFNPVIKDTFAYASPFAKTGYAVVGNTERASAIIDNQGKIIVPYTHSNIYMNEMSGYTLLISETPFDKKLPFWKWDWNIMSSDIKKTASYKHLEVRVLETGQVLYDKKIADRDDNYNFKIYPVDDLDVVWNGNLYTVHNGKFKIVKKQIEEVLDKGRYIPASNNKFEIWDSKLKHPIFSNLIGKTSISVILNYQELLLDSINQDRYAPSVPKILYDIKTSNIYIYPQYDKAFPKQISSNNEEHESFLKETSLIYSVNNSPYFILGKFNYDHDVWAYEWLYLDDQGNFHDKIPVTDFFITDQIGYTLWPSSSMLIPSGHIRADWVLTKIKYVQESGDLFIVVLTHKENKITKKGLWNRKIQKWEIEPNYTDITILDPQRHLYALNQEKEDGYFIYNNQSKQQVGQKSYMQIYANGIVSKKIDEETTAYYYVDLENGKEYKENQGMNNFIDINPAIIQKGIEAAKQKIENHYRDKFTYALPDWAMLTGDPTVIAVVSVHGNEGISVTKQGIDFPVDFNDEASIQHYADNLNKKMKVSLPVLGYVIFYKNILTVAKDLNYAQELTDSELAEITDHNSNNTTPDFSFIILTNDLNLVESTEELCLRSTQKINHQ